MPPPTDPLQLLWPTVDFTPTERDLLRYLLAASERAVPRDELLQRVWGYSPKSKTRTVQTTVQRVRVKIEPDPARPQYLVSLRGHGYRLQPPGAKPVARSVATSREEVERRIVQWLGPDQDWVTLVSRRERQTNLRIDSDPFIGRGPELDMLCRRLREGRRLVTLHGAAGLGKTRLSRELGQAGVQAFAGGVWFCGLEDAQSSDDLLSVVARTLGLVIAPRDERPMANHLVQLLSVRGPTLLILDNFEQLDDAATTVVQRLHDEVAELSVVVTSRRRLGLASEFVHPVEPLSGADATTLLQARARAAGVPQDAVVDVGQLKQIAALLEGVPLALEMAAASLRMMGLGELNVRLEKGVGSLQLGRSGAPRRQATLRGAIEWSWRLLSDAERTALVQMAVFQGGATLLLAENVVQTDGDTLAVFASLLDKSMLRRTHHDGTSRLALFESVREFVLEQADVGLNGARNRHADWALALARTCFTRRRIDPSVVEELSRNVDNLVAAVRWMLARRSAQALDILEGLYPLYRARFIPLDFPKLLRQLRTDTRLSPREHARSSVLLGWVFDLANKAEEALVEAESGLSRLAESDGLRGELTAIAVSSEVALQRIDAAVERGVSVLADAERYEWGDERILLLNAVGSSMHLARRTDEGMVYMRQGLQLASAQRSDGLVMTLRTNLGGHLASLGRLDEALEEFAVAESLAERFGDLAGLQIIRSNGAVAYGLMGRVHEADRLFAQVIESEERYGGRATPFVRRANAAYSALLVGDFQRAKRSLFRLEDELRQRNRGGAGLARITAYLVIALSALGEVQAAEALVPTVRAAPLGDDGVETELYLAHIQVAVAKRAGQGPDAECLQPVRSLMGRVGHQRTKLGSAVRLLQSALDGLNA